MLRDMRRTVRLSPLSEEHVLPLVVDLGFFIVLDAVLTLGFGASPSGLGAFALLALVVAFHFVQVRALVTLRFDDEGVTIVGPWRRRHVAWREIAGLVYTRDASGSAQSRSYYHLRLVLRGQEPPLGRYLAEAELKPYTKGPVLMALWYLGPDREGKAGRCQAEVFAELERHGFPPPEPTALEFRIPPYSPLALRTAVAADVVRAHGVVIEHGPDPSPSEADLLARTLPELARAHAAAETVLREPAFTTFIFERPLTEQDAARFLSEAAKAVPARWKVTPGILPSDPRTPGDAVR